MTQREVMSERVEFRECGEAFRSFIHWFECAIVVVVHNLLAMKEVTVRFS